MRALGGREPLLHMTTALPWADALRSGTYGAELVAGEGFIHLSWPDQVASPANTLFAGVADVWLLVIDPRRLPVQPVLEPGDPADPESELFPHLYAALPVDAVVAVVRYEPGPDGRFATPQQWPALG